MIEQVGFVGLGHMGSPMATRLLIDGTPVHVWSRRPESARAAVDAGAIAHTTLPALAAAVNTVVLMLPDIPDIEAVTFGDGGLLSAEQRPLLLIVCSSSSPDAVRRFAERVRELTGGGTMVVDAPVSGGVDGAEAGTLAIMLGGDDAPAAAAARILAPCGRVAHLGPLGSGQVAKACNQMIVAATVMALGEATALAGRAGLDVATMLNLLGGGYAGSRILETRGPKMAEQDYTVSGPARYMVKDLTFALEEASRTGTPLPSTQTLLDTFRELTATGFGDDDIAVTRKFIEHRSATPTQKDQQA